MEAPDLQTHQIRSSSAVSTGPLSPADSKLKAQDQSISEIAKPLFDSLVSMGKAGKDTKLKFTAGVIETRGLSEAGGETFTVENVKAFIQNLDAFVTNPNSALSDIEKIEAEIPKAIEGLNNLQNLYGSQFMTKGSTWIPGVGVLGLARHSYETEIKTTIESLQTSLELIKNSKDKRADLRDAGMEALIFQNELNLKSLDEIKVQLKAWGVLDENKGDSPFDELCQSLIKMSPDLLTNEEKYTILAKCIYVLDKPIETTETSIEMPQPSEATQETPIKKFNQETVSGISQKLTQICNAKGKTDETKVKNISDLIKNQVDVYIIPPKEEEINLDDWVVTENLSDDSSEEAAEVKSTLTWLGEMRDEIANINPEMLKTAIMIGKYGGALPVIGPAIGFVGVAAHGLMDIKQIASQTKTKKLSPEVFALMAKDPSNVKYASHLISGLPRMNKEEFAVLSGKLSDAEFTKLIITLNSLDDTLLDKLAIQDLPGPRKDEITLAALKKVDIEAITGKVSELAGQATKYVGDVFKSENKDIKTEGDQKTPDAEQKTVEKAAVAPENAIETPPKPKDEEKPI